MPLTHATKGNKIGEQNRGTRCEQIVNGCYRHPSLQVSLQGLGRNNRKITAKREKKSLIHKGLKAVSLYTKIVL